MTEDFKTENDCRFTSDERLVIADDGSQMVWVGMLGKMRGFCEDK